MSAVRRPLVLMILDGWGINPSCDHNAACQAYTPRLDRLRRDYPTTEIDASGLAVGLPEGQMGNSEVGHLNIGAGRIVYQELTRISRAIEQGDFFSNPVLIEAMAEIKRQGGKLHLMGLLSDGGVHSHNSHLYALVEMARQQGLSEVCIHAFLDGRDTPPQSGQSYLAQLEERLTTLGLGRVASVIGRYYAMDRDNRWERVGRAYQAMTEGRGLSFDSSAEAISKAYGAGQTDEFVEPCVINRDGASNTVDDGDGMIFFNFRADRAREISRTFTECEFSGFQRSKSPRLAGFVCLTEYDETFALPVAFPPASYPAILGEVVAKAGLQQLRIAETEKYAHVTFFFNGGSESPFAGEERVLIPSPQEVATYDQKPAMSAPQVTAEMLERVAGGSYDLIVLNFANPDMVGHTGVMDAAVEAMETVDNCVGQVVDAVLEAGGSLLITSDHGNCEQMSAADGSPHTAHTANPVPLILVDPDRQHSSLRRGKLADIAPTLLQLLGLVQPSEMTGCSLLQE
ncbi:phosphoglycerate mutase (2,3-diphosphoglycerate-independent) [Syntrophotalea acetylenivorans]|uniref:2,3-bisphosphoglycerate-independent phosphoglycerate mutase n=1 Tax=Syntrophotalea acetylenivorans TaxID=1842532 RepID=A0A1L3GQ38_9BACT|nr:2,3-bisphosphoglycerate-independent phosphoglycerate mutase [Syntrophotalea acetylenivorans]APG27788.1 phosphoglycerate mutase (2,3-diphosphoglycerate-independent) [Syntrophotalea acetylenivorans]